MANRIIDNKNKQEGKINNNMENYEIEHEIGRGSSGICYKAKCKTDGRLCAIKKITTNNLKRNSLKEAMKEVNMLKSLDHPNIIKYEDSFTDEHHLYIVMNFAERGDLHSIIKRRRIKQEFFLEEEIWEMSRQLLDSMAYLHSKNIIHRDFKTLNIFMNRFGHLLVGDLGVSKIMKAQLGLYSRVGTPLYLAPEIIKYQKYDFKADVWGLGCVLYILASFKHPFEGKNIISLGQNIVYSEPKKLSNFSEKLNELIFQMLQKSPNKRSTPKDLLQKYFTQPEPQKAKSAHKSEAPRNKIKYANISNQQSEIVQYRSVKKIRNNFFQQKSTNINVKKEEEVYIKSRGNIDVTKKNMEQTVLRKPAAQIGYHSFIPSCEQTQSKGKEKAKSNEKNSVSIQEKEEFYDKKQEGNLVIDEFCFSSKKIKYKPTTPKINDKVLTETQKSQKQFKEAKQFELKKRNIHSAKPHSYQDSQDFPSLIENNLNKKLTVSGNVHKLIYQSADISRQKGKNVYSRPKSSLGKGKIAHRDLKYIKKKPYQHHEFDIEAMKTRTQLLKKPEVVLI